MSRGHYKPGTLQRREDGRYSFDVRIGGKRYIRILGTDKFVAQRALNKLRHEKGERAVGEKYGVLLPDDKDPGTFNAAADEFFASYVPVKGDRARWEREAHYRLEHLRKHFGKVPFLKLSIMDIERYKTARLAETVPDKKNGPRPTRKSTINREFTVLKSMLLWWEKKTKRPVPFKCGEVEMFKGKGAEIQRERILTDSEELKLIAAAKGHLRDIIQTALWTGMRLGEILGLRWAYVRFAAYEIVLPGEVTKSGKDRRIPMVPELVELLKAQPMTGEHVFLNGETGKPFSDLKTSFTTARQRAGIRGLRFHDLRHTFATRFLRPPVNGDIVTLSRILGHANILMTARYAKPYPDDIRERMRGLVVGAAKECKKLARKAATAQPSTSATDRYGANYN